MVRIRETNDQRGIALIGAMVLVLILSLLGATILNLAGLRFGGSCGSCAAVSGGNAGGPTLTVVADFNGDRGLFLIRSRIDH